MTVKNASWTISSASWALPAIRMARRYARSWYVVTRRSAALGSPWRSASTSRRSRSPDTMYIGNVLALITASYIRFVGTRTVAFTASFIWRALIVAGRPTGNHGLSFSAAIQMWHVLGAIDDL